MSKAVYEGPDDNKEIVKKRNKFKGVMKRYLKDIDKNLDVVRNVLRKNKNLCGGISKRMEVLGNKRVVELGKKALEENIGVFFDGNRREFEVHFTPQALEVAVLSVPLIIVGCCVPAVAVPLIPSALVFFAMGVLCGSRPAPNGFVIGAKSDRNKIKQALAKIFKIMKKVRIYISEETRDKAKKEESNGEISENCINMIENFMGTFRSIWKEYSEPKNRKYDFLEIEKEIADLTKNIPRDEGILAEIDTLKKCLKDGKFSDTTYCSDLPYKVRKKANNLAQKRIELYDIQYIPRDDDSRGINNKVGVIKGYLKTDREQIEKEIAWGKKGCLN